MTKKQYMEFHQKICNNMMAITKAKNADYSGAGDDPFSNFRHIGNLIQTENAVEIGFLTRMSDKFSRIGSFISNGTLQVKDESVDDTLMDLANYSILFMGYLFEKRSKVDLNSIPIESVNGTAESTNIKSFGGGGPETKYCPECQCHVTSLQSTHCRDERCPSVI